ncbi:NAD(P)-binding domain-containing protein, partial [Alicyclobacillus mali (ex Roth et al. 2021)]
MAEAQVGVVGLAVMGKNLALNIESRGFTVAVYNRTASRTQELAEEAKDKRIIPAYSLQD